MNTQDQISNLKSLIEDIRECMLVTNDANVGLHSRPMSCSSIDEKGNLWFFTDITSDKVQEIYQDREVNCAFAKPSDKSYVSLTGKAEIVHDPKKKEELYSPLLDAWFDGPNDPKATLLCVKSTSAEYWNDTSSTIVTFAKIAAAAVTGKKYTGGENEKVKLS